MRNKNNVKKANIFQAIIVFTLLAFSSFQVVGGDLYPPADGPNYMGFVDLSSNGYTDVTMGDSFRFDIYGDIHSVIDTIATENLTYLPAGIVNFSSVTKGTLFNDVQTLFWLEPVVDGVVNNAAGYCYPLTWAVKTAGIVNNTNATYARITWDAVSVGTVTTTVASGGTARIGADPGTTKYTGTIRAHPVRTSSFDASLSTPTLVSFSWSKGAGAVDTVIRASQSGYPTETTGTEIYNDTGTSTTQAIGAGEHWYYTAWSYGGGLYSLLTQTDQVQSNAPPTFGTPSPTNGTGGQNPALTWSIPINDPEGNTFNYQIRCSTGQNTGLITGQTNGTKSISLTSLAYLVTYTVWVNATDPAGSGILSEAWYTFDTKANVPPTQTTPIPSNGTTGTLQTLTWSITLTDSDDLITWTIQCDNGQQTSGTNTASGSKSLSLSGLAPLTWYKVWVNVTDGLAWSKEWYRFRTADNTPPVYGTPSPADGAIDRPLSLTWSIPITDDQGDYVTWYLSCSNGHTSSGSGPGSGTTASIALTGLDYLTTYTVWVNATDATGSGGWTYDSYTFTTLANQPPNVPTIIVPSDGQTNVDPNLQHLRVFVTDPENHAMDVEYFWGNGTSIGTDVGVKSGHISQLHIHDLLLEYTNYSWYVNITDSHGAWTRGPAGAPVNNWTFQTGGKRAEGGQLLGLENELLVLVLFEYTPIPGAVITIYQTSVAQGVQTQGAVISIAATDSGGIRQFALPDGTYMLDVKAPGYKVLTQTITVATDQSIIVNLEKTVSEAGYWCILIFILIIVALLVTILTHRLSLSLTHVGSSLKGTIIVIILNVIALILALLFCWVLLIVGALLFVVEVLWLFGYVGK